MNPCPAGNALLVNRSDFGNGSFDLQRSAKTTPPYRALFSERSAGWATTCEDRAARLGSCQRTTQRAVARRCLPIRLVTRRRSRNRLQSSPVSAYLNPTFQASFHALPTDRISAVTQTIQALRLNGAETINPANPAGSVTRNLAVESTQLQDPQEGELLVEPLFVGVCGSDNSASTGKPNFDWVERPRTIGHEVCGRITGFGPATEGRGGLQQGDVVCIVPMRGCDDPRCRGCRRGRPNYCRKKQIYGFHRDGAMAEQMVVDVERCLKLAPGLTPLEGAVVEPLSVVAQGIHRKANIQPGMDVVVSGCGIIGLMAAELARAAGARVAVTGIERDRNVRLQLAQDRGFIPIVVSAERPLHEQLAAGLEDLDGHRFGDPYEQGTVDCLIECSGFPPALGSAGLSVQLEGHICVIATFATEVAFGATAFTRSGQSMQGVMGSSREDFETAQQLLLRGAFPVEAYSQQYAFEHVLEAMEDSILAKTPKAILAIND